MVLALSSALATGTATAAGGPHSVLLIIDPTSPESLYVGNYYKSVRRIPDRNVIYMPPGAADYASFADHQLATFFGMLANRVVEDHIDYVVIPPGGSFYVSAPGLVDPLGCTPFRRISISSAYTLAHLWREILDAGLAVTEANRFYADSDAPPAFDAQTAYLEGRPSASSRRGAISLASCWATAVRRAIASRRPAR
jgi:hypothetical protein